MKKINEIMNTVKKYTPNNEEEKEDLFNRFAHSRIDFFENIANKSNSEMKASELQQIAKLEYFGGGCPRCNKNWVEITFDNLFAKGKYFHPGCDCFFYCPYCEQHLYDYEVTGYLKNHKYICPHCGWFLIFDGNKRHGFEFARKIKNNSYEEKFDMLIVGHKVVKNK